VACVLTAVLCCLCGQLQHDVLPETKMKPRQDAHADDSRCTVIASCCAQGVGRKPIDRDHLLHADCILVVCAGQHKADSMPGKNVDWLTAGHAHWLATISSAAEVS
jgi:hypothetical protein